MDKPIDEIVEYLKFNSKPELAAVVRDCNRQRIKYKAQVAALVRVEQNVHIYIHPDTSTRGDEK